MLNRFDPVLLRARNIEEITFKMVGKDTFSLKIKAEMMCDDGSMEKVTIDQGYCLLDSEIKFYNEGWETSDMAEVGETRFCAAVINCPINIRMIVNSSISQSNPKITKRKDMDE